MKKNIFFLVFFLFSVFVGCIDEEVVDQYQKEETVLNYNGNNSIGKAFVNGLQISENRGANLETLLGDSKQLILDYAFQGSNLKDGCFYAIPICNKDQNSIGEYLLATQDLKNRKTDVVGLDEFIVVDENSLANNMSHNQYESYFLVWDKANLNIKPELNMLATNLNQESFLESASLRATGRYNVYEVIIDYSWDYSKLAIPTKRKVSNGTVSSAFSYVVYNMQDECAIEPIYQMRADSSSIYLLFYTPNYSLGEIKAIMNGLMSDLRDRIENESMTVFIGLDYKYKNIKVYGHGTIPKPDPDPDPNPPVNPWEPVEPGFPEDNQLNIHRRILGISFGGSKAFQDSLFKGDSLVDAIKYRSLGKSYIHALVEPGQTDVQVRSLMGSFFREQMELYFESGNAVHLGMALHPIVDSYCLGHEKRYWSDNQWHTDVTHCFEGKFKRYGDEDSAISALGEFFRSIMEEGQQDASAMFNYWLSRSYYGPLHPNNIIY